MNRRAPTAALLAACAVTAIIAIAAITANNATASPGAHGPNGEHLDGLAPSAGSGLARLPDGSVNVPKLAQRRMEIRTIVAVEAQHPVTAELNGRVAIDPNAGGRVQAPFAGQIEPAPQGLPVAGQRVRKGQVLARLRPAASGVDRANQEAALADLQAMRALAERKLARLTILEGTVPAKDIDAARMELASITGRERAIGASVRGSVAIVASANGVIAASQLLAGQVVEPRDVLFEIVDPGQLMVEALSTDVALAGRIASATLPAAPDARLTVLGGARSLRDGAVPISFRAQGKDLPLAVGQPVTVLVHQRSMVKGIALPAAALARNPANQTVVWIKSGAMRFIAQPVEVQALDARTVIVTRGLGAGNRVVVSGSSLINQIR